MTKDCVFNFEGSLKKYLWVIFFIVVVVFGFLFFLSKKINVFESAVVAEIAAAQHISSQYRSSERLSTQNQSSATVASTQSKGLSFSSLEAVQPANRNVSESTTLKIEELYNDSSYETIELASTLVKHGKMFKVDFRQLENLPDRSEVVLNIFGVESKGHISSHQKSGVLHNSFIKIDLQNVGEYMTVYIGSRVITGEIYTVKERYMFESTDDVGFIMPIFEFKKLNDALLID